MLAKWQGGNPTIRRTFSAPEATLVNLVLFFGAVVTTVSASPSSISTPVLAPTTLGMQSTATATIDTSGRRVPKQVGFAPGATVAGSQADHQQSGTHHHHEHGHGFMDHHGHGGYGGGHHGDGKYFTYAHSPAYGEYEYGYRRGNDYHFQERYEKYGPGWNFKTKVKWGDKYGGYGEHYWDYNHADSGHDDGHGNGHYSEPVPAYENQPGASSDQPKNTMIYKRQSDNGLRRRNGKSRHGAKRVGVKTQRSTTPSTPPSAMGEMENVEAETRTMPMLVLNRRTGHIIDRETGLEYWLKPNAQEY